MPELSFDAAIRIGNALLRAIEDAHDYDPYGKTGPILRMGPCFDTYGTPAAELIWTWQARTVRVVVTPKAEWDSASGRWVLPFIDLKSRRIPVCRVTIMVMLLPREIYGVQTTGKYDGMCTGAIDAIRTAVGWLRKGGAFAPQ